VNHFGALGQEQKRAMLIRELVESDLDALWALRLAALRDNPEAFSSTYDEIVARGPDWLEQRLRDESGAFFYLGAFDPELIGMVGFMREPGRKEHHKGTLISMYVAPAQRSRGVGRALVQELVARARLIPGLEQLHLTVSTTAQPAQALYRSQGFQIYGTARRALKSGGQYWDEDFMVLEL
jgi:ribosomal protein S18 acetylase RimI-like enzyme